MATAVTSIQACDTLVPSSNWQRPLHLAGKRFFDVLVSVLLLLLIGPFILILALAVKITSPGPAFYRWKVVGKNGRHFDSFKLRSMVVNADQLKAQLEQHNEMVGPVFKLSRDPRVTPLGFWMRRYSIDELPQLYSVLKGDMTLVGPRPPLSTEYERFTDYQKQKLLVKPGVTCLWQVNGRNEIRDFNEWVRLDLEYIRRWSLWLDFSILFKTIAVVFAGSGK